MGVTIVVRTKVEPITDAGEPAGVRGRPMRFKPTRTSGEGVSLAPTFLLTRRAGVERCNAAPVISTITSGMPPAVSRAAIASNDRTFASPG